MQNFSSYLEELFWWNKWSIDRYHKIDEGEPTDIDWLFEADTTIFFNFLIQYRLERHKQFFFEKSTISIKSFSIVRYLSSFYCHLECSSSKIHCMFYQSYRKDFIYTQVVTKIVSVHMDESLLASHIWWVSCIRLHFEEYIKLFLEHRSMQLYRLKFRSSSTSLSS